MVKNLWGLFVIYIQRSLNLRLNLKVIILRFWIWIQSSRREPLYISYFIKETLFRFKLKKYLIEKATFLKIFFIQQWKMGFSDFPRLKYYAKSQAEMVVTKGRPNSLRVLARTKPKKLIWQGYSSPNPGAGLKLLIFILKLKWID